MKTDLITRLEMLEQHGSEAEKRVARFLLEKHQDISSLSAIALGSLCDVSNASIVRFAQGLGYKGYSAFKLDYLSTQKQQSHGVLYKDLRNDDTTAEVIHKAGFMFSENVENALSLLEPEVLDMISERILNASRVAIFGVGASGVVASDIYQKLLRLNRQVMFHPDSHIQKTYACTLNQADIAIVLSARGNTHEVIQSLKIVRESGANIVAISKYGKTQTSKLSDYVLPFTYNEHHHELGMITPQLSQMMIFDILYFRIRALMGEEAGVAIHGIQDKFSQSTG